MKNLSYYFTIIIVAIFSHQQGEGSYLQNSINGSSTPRSFSIESSTKRLQFVKSQIEDINQEKRNLTKAQKKITTLLRDVIKGMKDRGVTMSNAKRLKASSFSTRLVKVDDSGYIQTYIYVTETSNKNNMELKALKVRIEIISDRWKVIQAWMPFDMIEEIANLDFVKRIQPPGYAVKRTGEVNSEGDMVLAADLARNMLGIDGSGVNVGVISDGVDSRSDAQSTGDLPDNIEADPLRPGRRDEGTAMLEIIHDLAPGASLAFSSGAPMGLETTSLGMIDAINFLADTAFEGNGADIIVDDLGFFDQPFFEDGPIAQTVDEVVANGKTYLSAAGNNSMSHYERDYVDEDPADTDDNLHDFGAAEDGISDTDMSLQIAPRSFLAVFLQWNDPFSASANDYDLFIFNQHGRIIARSTGPQAGSGDPMECAFVVNRSFFRAKRFFIVINRFSGDTNNLLEIQFVGGPIIIEEHNVPEGSVFGHQAAEGTIAVGAIDVSDPGNDDIEPFSSLGPARIFFPAEETRLKPDIAATDGNIITGAGRFGSVDSAGAFRFFGTSAAAPHAAAVAALVLSANPGLPPSEVKDALQSTAVDLGTVGDDNTFGAGKINAFAAVQAVIGATIPTPLVTPTPIPNSTQIEEPGPAP